MVLAITCGFVHSSLQGDEDHHEVVFRLYEGANPQESGENHVGKLYVFVYGHPFNTTFKTTVERFDWYEDGSFDVITADGQRHHVTPPENKLF